MESRSIPWLLVFFSRSRPDRSPLDPSAPLFKQWRGRFAFINEDDEYLGSSVFIVCLTRMFVNARFINADRIPPFTRCIYLHRSIVRSAGRGRNWSACVESIARYIRDNSSAIGRLHDYQGNASRACESLSIRQRKTPFPRVRYNKPPFPDPARYAPRISNLFFFFLFFN